MKTQKLTKKNTEDLTLEQGIKVQAIIAMPGWDVIESIIKVTKYNLEIDRKRKLAGDPTGWKALYFSGCVDGAEEVRQNVFKVVQEAMNMRETKKLMEEYNNESI